MLPTKLPQGLPKKSDFFFRCRFFPFDLIQRFKNVVQFIQHSSQLDSNLLHLVDDFADAARRAFVGLLRRPSSRWFVTSAVATIVPPETWASRAMTPRAMLLFRRSRLFFDVFFLRPSILIRIHNEPPHHLLLLRGENQWNKHLKLRKSC